MVRVRFPLGADLLSVIIFLGDFGPLFPCDLRDSGSKAQPLVTHYALAEDFFSAFGLRIGWADPEGRRWCGQTK